MMLLKRMDERSEERRWLGWWGEETERLRGVARTDEKAVMAGPLVIQSTNG